MAVDWAQAAAAPSVLEQQLTPRELMWLVTGIHEAGHMAVATHEGLELESSEIHQAWFSNSTEGWVYYREQEFEGDRRLSRLLSCLAGGLAEERFLIEYGIRSAEAHRQAMETSQFDMANFRAMSADTEWGYSYCRTRSEVLVDKLWPRIIVTGALICEKKRLSARQIEKVAG